MNQAEVEKKLKEAFNPAISKQGIENEHLFKKNDLAAVLATILVTTFLHKKAPDHMDTWELVEEKAQGWIKLRLGKMGDLAEPFEKLRSEIEGPF